MALPNISKLNYNELVGLEAKVSAAIAKRKQDEKADLKRRIAALAKNSGFDLDEIVGSSTRRGRTTRGKKVAPKYRHPKDAALTWTGRGRQPLWLASEIKKGKKLDSFLIN
jgi:DNA-binding protein H-NS